MYLTIILVSIPLFDQTIKYVNSSLIFLAFIRHDKILSQTTFPLLQVVRCDGIQIEQGGVLGV